MPIYICDVHTDQAGRELTAHGNSLFPVACYEDNLEVMSVSTHWHDEFEYIYAFEGSISLRVGTEPFTLKQGEGIFINSGILHSVSHVTGRKSVLRSLVIHPRLIGGSTDSIFWKKLILPLSENSGISYILLNTADDWQTRVNRLMMDAWDTIRSEPYDYENEARYLISGAFRQITDHLTTCTGTYRQDSNTIGKIKQVLSFIELHFNEDLNNKILMEQLSCSESVLLRSFKKVTGTTPMHYLLDFRMERAMILLESTTDKSSDIAASCGFNDFSYFTKVFREHTGLTPIAYRNQKKQTVSG